MISPLAIYVPCSAHPLNIVGISAADCCQKSVVYLNFLQEVYNYFTASTYRWEILISYFKKSKGVKNVQ